MKAITVETMKFLESKAINEYGIPSVVLMENAASGFVRALNLEYGNTADKKVCVLCGKGNNGGDGYAIARLLHFGGAKVSVISVFDTPLLSGDAKTNANALKNMGVTFINNLNGEYDIIIDAIFGTGFHGEVKSPVKELIEEVNNSNSYIASVDVPSGVSLTEATCDCFIKCDLCVTFGYAKVAQFTGAAQSSFKKLIVAPISIPEPDEYSMLICEKCFSLLPRRNAISHKGTFGKVLAYVGSYGMAGAAVLSGSAALKSGAGMLTLAVPDDIIPTIVHEFPSAMTLPLNNSTDISHKAIEMDALLIGCGLGTSDTAKENLIKLINCQMPTVIDADGLNLLCENVALIKDKNVVLTPHVAEFSRLCGVSIAEIKKNPIKHIMDFCTQYGVCIVLKDAVTLICDKSKKLAVCHAPNSGMATAGSGDVLAGIITSILAQGLNTFDAACAGVYAHAAAGLIAKERLGEAGMTSLDILSSVPKAFMSPFDITPHIKEL
ncbi:MAG: NAD(P)H-hydrate dehydratase [Clostridia bacterium]|nr:NAD(P)H-hydrate dehydratase [Clostridia bacterium]